MNSLFPTLISTPPLWNPPGISYVPHSPVIVYSPGPWPVNLYQPPMSQDEVTIWSKVHRYCLGAPKYVASKILPTGRRNGRIFKDGNIIVALRRCFVPEVGRVFERGEWTNLMTGACGRNHVELYAHVHAVTYRQAVQALAIEGDLIAPDGEARRRANRMIEERNPLHLDHQANWIPPCYPVQSMLAVYRNASHHAILQAIQWQQFGGESVTVYRTLIRPPRSADCQWEETLPSAPFPLFGANVLQLRPHGEVIFVKDEFLAQNLNVQYPNLVFCAVPGGMSNVLRADLGQLRGRPVRVVLEGDELAMGHRIQHAFIKAGVATSQFSLSLEAIPRSFDDLERVAAARGVSLLPPPAEQVSTDWPGIVVTEPGQAIPGGDKQRRVLIHPIIREGYLVWLYAEPKIGKTWLALALAHAAARGNCRIGRWQTMDAVGVLYVDGEMLPDELAQAVRIVMKGAGDPPGAPLFSTICARLQRDGEVDLTSEATQQHIEGALDGVKLLILDNFQSLSDNGPGVLDRLRPWLGKLARADIAVVVIDHTNREGLLQGSIAKERIANLSIALRYPDDEAKADGRILVEFPVARKLHGRDAQPFALQKIFTDDALYFAEVEAEADVKVTDKVRKIAQVVFGRSQNLSFREIQSAYGIAPSTAHGYLDEAERLSGDDRVALDAELRRLAGEDEPTEF